MAKKKGVDEQKLAEAISREMWKPVREIAEVVIIIIMSYYFLIFLLIVIGILIFIATSSPEAFQRVVTIVVILGIAVLLWLKEKRNEK